ncbi:ABC-three component system middle component 7 [Methylotuvimicrobium buryatense]|uniref:Uncharacterized protein n=2 Tax=Methylotuvimicrobium buryatense TaxID=95641 RepID=A0A4V1IK49_METBY|nr:hypothetical protein EQU24_16510 [Methylotuvimicrobium buryatense]
MLVPSKFTRLEESTIFKMKCILADKNEVETVLDVYIRTKDSFYDVSEFIHALDVLYVLGLLNINNKTGLVEYA